MPAAMPRWSTPSSLWQKAWDWPQWPRASKPKLSGNTSKPETRIRCRDSCSAVRWRSRIWSVGTPIGCIPISRMRRASRKAAVSPGSDAPAVLLLRSGDPVFVRRITVVARADEGDHFPEIIRTLDDRAHGRHRAYHGTHALAGVTVLLQFGAA